MHGALREHHRLQQQLVIRDWEAQRWLLHLLLENLDGGQLGVRGAAQFPGPGAGPEGETPESRQEVVFWLASVTSQLHAWHALLFCARYRMQQQQCASAARSATDGGPGDAAANIGRYRNAGA